MPGDTRAATPRRSIAMRLLTGGLVAIGSFVVLAFPFGLLRSVRVTSINMMPTLAFDDRVVVRSYGANPGLGDVVVYRSPFGDALLVGRIVATGGETVEMDENGLLRGGCPVAVPAVAPSFAEADASSCSIDSAPAADCSADSGCAVPTCSEDAVACDPAEAASPLLETEAAGDRCYFTRKAGLLSSLFFERRLIPDEHVFVLNDNRVDERDSRIYGAIPLHAVVGVASFVYYAKDGSGIRWDRINRRVS